ncbi:DUF3139 domain-containing protein [Peribacillus sp. NPDC096379]|uniref:DUF3139 domain-containing protein n=1 Tax=Peribacillus sp. NPDC096379 TaxID=3364393 RepID=UPI003830D878
MKKFLIVLFSFFLIFLLVWGGIKLNFFLYEKRANERIAKVIEYQGASKENSHILVNVYDYKRECWYQKIKFKDDPEISYQYEYTRSEDEVRIFAMYNNMSLDLANKKSKYPVYDVYFKDDKIIEVNKR